MNEELESTAEVQGNPPDEEQTAREEKIAELTKTAREQMAKKKWEDALKTYAQVLSRQQQAEDRVGIARTKNDMASIYLAQREWQQALDLLERSREILIEAGDPEQESVALNNMAAAQYELGDWKQALEHYETALSIRHEMDDQVGVAKTLRNIGMLYAKQRNMMKAKIYLNRAVAVAKRAKSPQMIKVIRKSLSQLGKRRR